MSIRVRSLITGLIVALGVACILWANIEYPFLVFAMSLVAVFAGMALGSWWSLVVVPAGFVVGFWLIAAYVTLSGEPERITDGFLFQFLFVFLVGLFGVILAAAGTLVVKILGPGASGADE